MEYNYELIICIVNAGFSDDVIVTARRNGCTGGTIIHGRGTANRETLHSFGLSEISPDKDVILMAVKKESKDIIMQAIYNKAGLDTAAKGLAFSLPITSEIGIKNLT